MHVRWKRLYPYHTQAVLRCCTNHLYLLFSYFTGQSAYMRLPKSAHSLLEAIGPMMVKGKATPLQAYKYVGTKTTSSDAITNISSSVGICGSGSGRVVRSGVDEGEQIPEGCRAVFVALLARLSTATTTAHAPIPSTNTTSGNMDAPVTATIAATATTITSDVNVNATTCVVDLNVPCIDCVADIPITVTTTNTTNTNTTTTNTLSTAATPTTATTIKPTPSTTTPKANRNALSSWLAFPSFTTNKPATTTTLPVILISGNEGSGRTSAVMWLKNQALERKRRFLAPLVEKGQCW